MNKYFFGEVEGKIIKGTSGSVGYDVYSAEECELRAGDRNMISTDLYIKFKEGYAGILKSRSSFAMRGVDVCGGVIDTDYEGEIKVILHNAGKNMFKIEKNMRIAQLIIIENLASGPALNEIRGVGGFGSTNN